MKLDRKEIKALETITIAGEERIWWKVERLQT
jgi:hypothetical protein